jgi:hypothetical protein
MGILEVLLIGFIAATSVLGATSLFIRTRS